MKPTTSEWIRVSKSKIHNRGVFAAKDIPKGTRVIEYVGDKLTKKQSDKRADEILEENIRNPDYGAVYIFELNKTHDIDGSPDWNTAKWINHSCDPNCEVDIIRGHIWVIATRDIKKGEEITYNYGYDWDDDWEDHPCRCGSKNCVGYILDDDHWPKLRKELAKRNK